MDNAEIIRQILLAPISICVLVMIVVSPIAYFKIVKPFDKLFIGKGLTIDEGVWYVSIFIRLSQYVLCVVFPNRSKTDKYAKLVYEGYDFRGNANVTQIFLSYIYLICVFIVVFFGVLVLLYDFVISPTFSGAHRSVMN